MHTKSILVYHFFTLYTCATPYNAILPSGCAHALPIFQSSIYLVLPLQLSRIVDKMRIMTLCDMLPVGLPVAVCYLPGGAQPLFARLRRS